MLFAIEIRVVLQRYYEFAKSQLCATTFLVHAEEICLERGVKQKKNPPATPFDVWQEGCSFWTKHLHLRLLGEGSARRLFLSHSARSFLDGESVVALNICGGNICGLHQSGVVCGDSVAQIV